MLDSGLCCRVEYVSHAPDVDSPARRHLVSGSHHVCEVDYGVDGVIRQQADKRLGNIVPVEDDFRATLGPRRPDVDRQDELDGLLALQAVQQSAGAVPRGAGDRHPPHGTTHPRPRR